MSTRVSVDKLGDAIMEQLLEYKNLTREVMVKAVEDAAKTVLTEIQKNAPVHSGPYKNRNRQPGAYKRSWRQKRTAESATGLSITIYSAQHYRLTHLLENGHAKRGGGRTRAFPHIAPAEEKGEEQLLRDIQRGLKQ